MDVLVNAIVALVIDDGYPILAVVVLVSAAGVPLPTSLILIISGSVAGLDRTNLLPLFVLVTASSLAGDSVGYFLGKMLGGGRLGTPRGRWAWLGTAGGEVQRYFRPWSGLTVFLTRWLLSPLSSAVNLLAGISRYPFGRFLAFAAAGEAVSSGLFLGVGYVFGVNSTYVADYFNGLPGILVAGALGLLLTGIGISRLLRPKKAKAQHAG